jgi:hypothetical protein
MKMFMFEGNQFKRSRAVRPESFKVPESINIE